MNKIFRLFLAMHKRMAVSYERRAVSKLTAHSSQLTARPGFTLMELIIYVGLTSMVVVALLNVMLAVIDTREKSGSMNNIQQELRFIMDRMTYTTRNAEAISGSTIFDTSTGALTLSMPSSSVNPTVFFYSGSQIYVQEGTRSSISLTSKNILIEELRFTDLTAPGALATVRIRVRAKDKVPVAQEENADEMTLTTSVTLRQ